MERMHQKKMTRMKSKKSKKCVQTGDDKKADEAKDMLDLVEKQAKIIRDQLNQIVRLQTEIEMVEEFRYLLRCQVSHN